MSSTQKGFVPEISTEMNKERGSSEAEGAGPRKRVCFSELGQHLFDFLRRGVHAFDVVDHLMPKHRKPGCATHFAVSLGLEVQSREHHGSIRPGRIDLHQAVWDFDQTPRGSYPAGQRDILGHHFFCAFNRKLGPVDALPGIGKLRPQNIGRHPVGFHIVHGILTHGGPDRSLMPGETGAASRAD